MGVAQQMMSVERSQLETAGAENGLLPSLIIAGAPKSGTSSLFRWMVDHPSVLGSTVKETYYFVDPETHMFDCTRHFLSGGIGGYRHFFPKGKTSPRVVVEATPSYLYSELALRELPRLASRPHFLFLLREPASQIYSTFRYFQSNWNWIPNNVRFLDFVTACSGGTHRFGGNELAQNALRNAAYVDFLMRWRDACGAERLHVFLFEEVLADKRQFMRKLAGRFGIDPDFYNSYDFPAENQTYSVRSKLLQRVNISVRSSLPRGVIYNAARSIYRNLNTCGKPMKEARDEELEIRLAEAYRKANERLAAEFELNIAAWHAIQQSRLEQRPQ